MQYPDTRQTPYLSILGVAVSNAAFLFSNAASNMLDYAALVVSPRALPDGLILVFQHPDKRRVFESVSKCASSDSIHAAQAFVQFGR